MAERELSVGRRLELVVGRLPSAPLDTLARARRNDPPRTSATVHLARIHRWSRRRPGLRDDERVPLELRECRLSTPTSSQRRSTRSVTASSHTLDRLHVAFDDQRVL